MNTHRWRDGRQILTGAYRDHALRFWAGLARRASATGLSDLASWANTRWFETDADLLNLIVPIKGSFVVDRAYEPIVRPFAARTVEVQSAISEVALDNLKAATGYGEIQTIPFRINFYKGQATGHPNLRIVRDITPKVRQKRRSRITVRWPDSMPPRRYYGEGGC